MFYLIIAYTGFKSSIIRPSVLKTLDLQSASCPSFQYYIDGPILYRVDVSPTLYGKYISVWVDSRQF